MSMRCVGCTVGLTLIALTLLSSTGCVSLDKWRRENSARLALEAQKEEAQQRLRDCQDNEDVLKKRLELCELSDADRESLLAQLQSENERLQEAYKNMQNITADVARREGLGAIQITGPALPAALDSALQRFAQQFPNEVDYDPATGSVKWKSDIVFALGSDVVKDSAKAALTQFAEIVKSQAAEGFDVLIVGHTDTTPIVQAGTKAAHPTNWHLSAHRSISVANLMLGSGVPTTRVGISGYSEYRPIADNASADGKSKNRRVEIYLVPSKTVSSVRAAG